MKMMINMYFTNEGLQRNMELVDSILLFKEGEASENHKGYFTNLFFACLFDFRSRVKIFHSIAYSSVNVWIICLVRGVVLQCHQVRVGRSRCEMVNGRVVAVLYPFRSRNYQLPRDFQLAGISDCILDCYQYDDCHGDHCFDGRKNIC